MERSASMLFERSEDVAQLAVSKNAAATLGIAIPASVLTRANCVIGCVSRRSADAPLSGRGHCAGDTDDETRQHVPAGRMADRGERARRVNRLCLTRGGGEDHGEPMQRCEALAHGKIAKQRRANRVAAQLRGVDQSPGNIAPSLCIGRRTGDRTADE
jgi:hypothetical protein